MISHPGFVKIVLLISLILFANSVSVYCSELDTVKDAFINSQSSGGNVSVTKTRVAGSWALLSYVQGSYKGTALMNRTGSGWTTVANAGINPTTDILRSSGVPKASWDKLLDPSWIQKSQPVVDAMHSQKSKNYIILSAKIAGDWALAEWSMIVDGEIEGEGQALLKNINGKWKVKESGGGAMGGQILRGHGVPESLIHQLLP